MEGRISLKGGLNSEGSIYNANYTDGSYIILNDRGNDYNVLSSLAHEMGHHYEFTLTKNNKRVYSQHNLSEVPALFMQRLFDDYMRKFTDYKERVLFCEVMWQNVLYKRTLSNKFTNQMYLNNMINSLDYERGVFIFKDDVFSNNNIRSQNWDVIVDYMPSLENYLYVICDIIAINLVQIYHDSPKEGLLILKKLITEYPAYRKILVKYAADLSEYAQKIKEASSYIKELK